MIIDQKPKFNRTYKKSNANQLRDVNIAIQIIAENPETGNLKSTDLTGMRVHKFRMNKQMVLMAYDWHDDTITLLALGSHENFYRGLGR